VNPILDAVELVEQLDRLITREGARLRIPGDADGSTTVGTQQGYLRLGVEFLRAGLAPRAAGDVHDIPHVPLDVAYLLTADSRAPFELCELVDEVEPLPPRRGALGALGQLLAAMVAVLVLGLVVVGALAVLSRIFR
jgi:hypothetical protein